MLKHKQMVDSCRGDGINSCRICGVNFAPQKGDDYRLAGNQLCAICMKVQLYMYSWKCLGYADCCGK